VRRLALAVALLLALATPARAQPWGDPDDDRVKLDPEKLVEDDFWGQIARPNYARYLRALRIGKDELRRGHPAAAEARLQEAIALEPRELDGYLTLGALLSAQQRWAECAATLAEVRKIDPDYPDNEYAFKAGFCYALAARFEESLDEYRRYQPGEGRSPYVKYWNMGDTYMALGRLEDAIASYRQALALGDTEAMGHFALGVALDRDEQLQAARDEIGKGIQRDPSLNEMNSPSIFFVPAEERNYYLGFIQQERGMRALSIAHWRTFIAKQPAGPWTTRARDHLAELGGPRPSEKELIISGAQPPNADRTALSKLITAAMPLLSRCLASDPPAVVRVDIVRPAGGGARVITTAAPGTPAPPNAKALACVRGEAEKMKLPPLKTGTQTLVFPVVAP